METCPWEGDMMLRDEFFKTSVFTSPPENLEVALERGQLMNEPEGSLEVFRRACEEPPKDMSEAKGRLKACGMHVTNVIGMVWKNLDQFVEVLREYDWKSEVYWDKRTMDAGRFRQMYLIATPKTGGKNKLILWLWDQPHRLTVTCAVSLSTSEKSEKLARKIKEMIDEHTGPLDIL